MDASKESIKIGKPVNKIMMRIGQDDFFTDNDIILPIDIRSDGEFMLKLSSMATKQGYHVAINAEVEE